MDIMELLNQALALPMSAEGATVTIGLVLDYVFRRLKTKKPLSIAHMVAAVAHKLADVLERFADVLDKILPQNVDDVSQPPSK